MQKRIIAVLLGAILFVFAFSGCAARRDSARDLSANDIIGVLGNDYDTMKQSIGTLSADENEARAKSYRYTRSVMGSNTDFSLTMDDNDKVEKIVVYTDENGLKTWKNELGLKYGVSASNTWRDDKTKISVSDVGDTKMIFIEKNL